ncbi:MAG: glutathione S-transferase family protein [Solirubrobacterales bacterium]
MDALSNASSSRLRLVAIPISHYCEKARWALERAGIDYEEERHLQGFHHYYAKRRGGDFTTPVLVFPDGRPSIGQSSEILRWVNEQLDDDQKLYPLEIASRVRATEHWLDATLGPDGRGWLYGEILDDARLIERYGLDGIPANERRVFWGVFKLFKPYLAARIRVQGTQADQQSVRDVFDEIADRLADGRRYLMGDQFTAADLTFAALSAAVILPRNYGVELPPLDSLPTSLRSSIEDFRAHPAGEFALRMFAEERPTADWLAKTASELATATTGS